METQTAPRPQPQSLADIFFTFTILALQGFGGVMAIVQYELVERKRWMSYHEFVEEWAVAQILPGPNVINLALVIGNRYFGLSGALSALAGMLLVPTVIVVLLAVAYAHFSNNLAVAGALRGMGAVAAGLIIVTGLKLGKTITTHPLGKVPFLIFCALCFVAIAWLHWPLSYTLLLFGALSCVLTYRRISP